MMIISNLKEMYTLHSYFRGISQNISKYRFVSYFDHKRDDDIYSSTWDPPEEILNGCNISKFKIITYFSNLKPKYIVNTIYLIFTKYEII